MSDQAGTCTVTVNVTATLEGLYLNTLSAGALQTTKTNNTAATIATLTVNTTLALSIPLAVSDEHAGSVLIYNFYTSNPTSLNSQNTRINLTNTNTTQSVASKAMELSRQ